MRTSFRVKATARFLTCSRFTDVDNRVKSVECTPRPTVWRWRFTTSRMSLAPVRRQLLVLLRDVNAARRQACFQVLRIEVLALRRRIVKPFGEDAATLMPAVPHDLATLPG